MIKNTLSKYVLLFFLTLTPAICFAQRGRICGKLTFNNGAPVASALVYIESLQKYSTSGEDGSYVLDGIPYGTYNVGIKMLQVEDFNTQIRIDAPEVAFSPRLTQRINRLKEVKVQSESEEQRLRKSGFAMNSLDTRKMEAHSFQTTELLDRTAGVRIRQSGGMGSDMQFNINGLSGSAVRVFIDGIPIRNYGSSFSLSSIPPAMIERVEVYKGVVPAELGEDALGGAINVVLRKKASNTLSTSYSYGSFNTHRWDMNGRYHAPRSGFNVSGSAFYNSTDNSYKVWGNDIYVTEPTTGEMTYVKAKRFHDDYRSYGLNADVGFADVRWADFFAVGILASAMEKDIQHGAVMSTVYGNRTTGQNTLMGNVKYEKRDLLNNLDVNILGSYSYALREVVDTTNYRYNWLGNKYLKPDGSYYRWSTTGEGGKATLAKNNEKMWAGRANMSYRFLRGQKVSANLLYNRFTRNVDDPMLSAAEQELLETRYMTKAVLGANYEGMWLDDKLRTSIFYKRYYKKVRLTDPIKVDGVWTANKYANSMNTGGYGCALSYAFAAKVVLMFSAEKALRLPSDTELLGNTSESIDASYDLKPESSININAGLNLGAFRFGGVHSIGGNVNFFYRDVTDMITRSVPETSGTKVEDTFRYMNLDNVLSRGFDAEFFYNYNGMIILTSNFSLFNARFNTEYDTSGNKYPFYGDRLRNAPYLTSNTNVEFVKRDLIRKGTRLSVYYNFGYVHEFYRNWESRGSSGKQTIPTQLVHDAGVAYAFSGNGITLSFDIRNITDEQVFDNWALQKAGRAFYAKISYKIL